jgi:hypothetical protein
MRNRVVMLMIRRRALARSRAVGRDMAEDQPIRGRAALGSDPGERRYQVRDQQEQTKLHPDAADGARPE